MKRKKGECVTLHCERCSWGTELPMADTLRSSVVPCAHCQQPLYWNCCPGCGLCYLGRATPSCPSCDDDSLDELETL